MGDEKDWWHFENLSPVEPNWGGAGQGDNEYDNIDFHLDLGCGKLKKGRLGVDHFWSPQVDLIIDLNKLLPPPGPAVTNPPEEGHTLERTANLYMQFQDAGPGQGLWSRRFGAGLPFPDDSIESIISHHALEHIGDGFMHLMNEAYRVLVPGGIFRIITPLFPSRTAVEDPDHRRYFMEGTFDAFCGTREGAIWLESFSVPYTKARFEMVGKDMTARNPDPAEWWGEHDAREIRVALRKWD